MNKLGEEKNSPSCDLVVFDNPRESGIEYTVTHYCPEFTCVCPKTGQPDFAEIVIEYIPYNLCVELKSLKMYLWKFRDEGHFHEDVVNQICVKLVKTLYPQKMKVTGKFNPRGGIHTNVVVEFDAAEQTMEVFTR